VNGSYRKVLAAKIHRAKVTAANVDYEGSITVPPELLKRAGIVPYESVSVWNVTRGTRLETYAIVGEPGTGEICANGAAAHLIHPGDHVILATWAFVPEEELSQHRPRVVFVDAQNQFVAQGPEVAGPKRRSS
jgi:aspartate 1-decarboxylase